MGPLKASSALARCVADRFGVVDAHASKTLRSGAAGGWANAFMVPPKPRITSPDGTIEPLTENGKAVALNVSTVLSSLDFEHLVDPSLRVRA